MSANEIHLQDHDVVVQLSGLNVPVYVNDTLSDNDGWRGGQWVYYTSNVVGESQKIYNIREVGPSDGNLIAGFLLRGSDFHPPQQSPGGPNNRRSGYNFSSYQPTTTKVITMIFDGSYIFKVYEQFAYGNRTGTGTPLTYSLNDALYISDRGYLTTEADALAAGIATPLQVGVVWLAPSEPSKFRLGADIRAF